MNASRDRPVTTVLLLRRHPVAAFLGLAFAISWGGILAICLPTGIAGSGEALARLRGPVLLVMLAGPFLSALIVSLALGGWVGLAGLLRGRGVVMATAIGLGAVHGLWHLLSGLWGEGAELRLVFVPYFLTAWILAVVALRILAVWLVERTGSTFLGARAHASHTGGLLAIRPPATAPVQDLLWTAAFAALGLTAVLAVTRLAENA